ncbi:MAG: GHKL domain-containing protein [Lachnospira pectinoschiza]
MIRYLPVIICLIALADIMIIKDIYGQCNNINNKRLDINIVLILMLVADIILIYTHLEYERYESGVVLLLIILIYGKLVGSQIYANIAKAVFYISISINAAVLADYVLKYISIQRNDSYMLYEINVLCVIILFKVICLVMFGAYKRYVQYTYNNVYYVAVTVMKIIGAVINICVYSAVKSIGYYNASIIVVILFINVLTDTGIVFLNIVRNYASVSYEREMLEQEIETCRILYDNIKTGQDELRDIRHDIKNRLNMLCYSLDENNIEQARKAIGVLYDNIDASSRIFYCNNLKVNTMLEYKFAGLPDNINVQCDIDIPDNLDMDMGDLGVIIGNLLDNSINAVKKIDGEAYINVVMKYSAESLFITIKNSYIEDNTIKSAVYYIDHGRGIKNVKRLVDKYRGSYSDTKENGVYTTNLSISI